MPSFAKLASDKLAIEQIDKRRSDHDCDWDRLEVSIVTLVIMVIMVSIYTIYEWFDL